MIAGGYTLHLYCDYCDTNQRSGSMVPDEFFAETGGECRKNARKRGWRLDWSAGLAKCPACVKTKKTEVLDHG